MYFRLMICLILFSMTSACSTVSTHTVNSSQAGPYSGTQMALRNMKRSTGDDFVLAGEFWFFAADVPLSFVADTLIMPYHVVAGTDKRDELRPTLQAE